MIGAAPRPPRNQRRFTSVWAELDYICKKVRYWIHIRQVRSKALPYRQRLERVLRETSNHEEAILREEGFALLGELTGDLDQAIAHREQEIALMRRLHRDARSSRYNDATRAYMLRDRDASVLADREALLRTLKERVQQSCRVGP